MLKILVYLSLLIKTLIIYLVYMYNSSFRLTKQRFSPTDIGARAFRSIGR